MSEKCKFCGANVNPSLEMDQCYSHLTGQPYSCLKRQRDNLQSENERLTREIKRYVEHHCDCNDWQKLADIMEWRGDK